MKEYNKKHKNNEKNKFYLLLFCLLIVFVLSFYLFKNSMSSVLTYISYPYMYISDFFSSFANNNDLVEQNNLLTKENLNLKIQLEKNKTQEEEINTLKEMLDLKNIYTNYQLVNSTIISKNKDYFFNSIIIDKGKDYGIEKNYAVVSSNGLIGKVEEVYEKTSKVNLITSNIKISVKIIDNDKTYYGMINDVNNNKLILEGLDNFNEIKEDSKVFTTGYGIFPEGIYIGKIKKDNNLYVEIEDLNNIKYVLVLGNKIND